MEEERVRPFPGTMITGADLQWWTQYSLTLPSKTLSGQEERKGGSASSPVPSSGSRIRPTCLSGGR